MLLQPPVLTQAPEELGPEQRRRLLEVVTRAVQRAAEAQADPGVIRWVDVAGSPDAPPARGPGEWDEPRERVPPGALGGEETIALRSFDDGRTVRIPVGPAIEVGGLDRVIHASFPRILVARKIGNVFMHAGGSPYVESFNLARAQSWGRVLFGGRGFAVFHRSGDDPSGPFYAVGLTRPISARDFGRAGERLSSGVRPVPSEVLSVTGDLETVLVQTSDEQQLVSLDPTAVWFSERLVAAYRAITPDEARIDPAAISRVGESLLRTADYAQSVEVLANFDRAMFAAMPWERRAHYLQILVDAWTGEREEIAIIEIIHATRSTSELEAIFAILRRRDVYRRLFRDLDGRVFELLTTLGEFRTGEAPTWQWIVSVLVDAGLLPGSATSMGPDDDPIRDLQRLVDGAEQWLVGMAEGLIMLVSRPDEVIEGLGHLVELLWTIEKARWGDPDAVAVVNQMAKQIGRKLALAYRGLEYADQLGTPVSARGRGDRVSGDILGRLKWMVVAEVASWFIGIGEVKAAVTAAGTLPERIAALARALRALRFAGRAGRVAEAARLERVLVALGRVADIDDAARLARLAEALPESHLAQLQRIAERVDLPEGAGVEALRTALAAEPELLGAVDRLAEALRATARLEARAADAGAALADLLPGFKRLMREGRFEADSLARLVDDIPPGNLRDFMHAVEFVTPEQIARWLPADFAAIGRRPRAIAFVREAGGEIFEIAFTHEGGDWARFERFLEGIEARRASATPEEYQHLLDRLRQRQQGAYDEVAEAGRARRVAEAEATGRIPEYVEQRLRQRGHEDLLDWFEDMSAADRQRYGRELARLSDKELDGLAEISKLPEEQVSLVGSIDDILAWDPQLRKDLLEMVAEIAPRADDTLGGVLHGILQRTRRGERLMQPGVQGSLGQLYAGRTAVRRGATAISFEVDLPGRHVDLEAVMGGRTVHVEVKTPIEGPPGFEPSELTFDIANYAGDAYQGLKYVYTPGADLTAVKRRMRNWFERPDVQQALAAKGIDPAKARQAWHSWVDSDAGVGHYEF